MAPPDKWRLDRRRSPTRLASGALGLVVLSLLAFVLLEPTSAAEPDGSDVVGGAAATFLAELLGPDESFAPVEIELTGTLPRGGTFQGVELTVARVHLTNTHPYTMFGEPKPGREFYVVVELTASNLTAAVNDYGFGDETFDFRTWSGRLLAHVPSPGRYEFARLEPGDVKTDELVFGTEDPDVLAGSALLVGREPDARIVIPLTAPPLVADYPAPVEPTIAGPYQAGAVTWSIEAGQAGLDRPPGVCCPETGSRADEGELFLTIHLVGQVKGSKYGQATVSSEAVRLVVDGEAVAPFGFAGQANVPEGEAYAFPATWLTHEDDTGLILQFLDSGEVASSVPLLVGEAGMAAAPFLDLPEPAAPTPGLSPTPVSSSVVSASAAPSTVPAPRATSTPLASPGPVVPGSAPSLAPAPTPRPVMAAIATLLIYSGVPNPDWALTQEDLDALGVIAASLAPVDGLPPEGNLGYRGFRVTGPRGTWRANDGLVMTPDTAPDASLADPDRLVERYLLASGLSRDGLTEDEAAIVSEALEQAPGSEPA
jgi:hypothetical protein